MPVGTIGKYERLDVLGHGTSGIVYLAWDTMLRRNVALKEIRAAGTDTERIIEEARLLERLRGHPNIVEVHSVDRVDDVILIDMELVRGMTLADMISRREGKPLPPAEAITIAVAVLSALEHAHTRRIVHRDVKPANILIPDDRAFGVPVVKLTDFGLAEALGTGSVAGGGGTYPYMAPEDFAAEADSDYRSDLWAVGVILYEMLTGKRPFNVTRKKDPFAWKRAIDTDEPENPAKIVPGLPVALGDVVMKALAKDKTKRFPTAQMLARTLESISLPQVIVATPPSIHSALPTAPDGSPYLTFRNGTVGVYTLDELRDASAKYWEEGKAALVSGQMERFLRAIGEVYIADLAKELSSRSGQSADTRLFEFIERSGADDLPDATGAEERTVAGVVAALPVLEVANKSRPRRWFRAKVQPIVAEPVPEVVVPPAPVPSAKEERKRQKKGVPSDPLPDAPPPAPLAEGETDATRPKRGVSSGWWFLPVLLLCISPPFAAMLAEPHLSGRSEGQFNNIQQAMAMMGMLSAMLLIAGTGAKVPALLRAVCFIPMAIGVLCLGAMGAVSVQNGLLNVSDAPLRVAGGLLAPVILLISQAITAKQGWKFWILLISVAAIAISAYHLRPMF